MESVMNFLAENYIWFFVAAGVLCFALIGFILDSRKKKNNEVEEVAPLNQNAFEETISNEPAQNIETSESNESNEMPVEKDESINMNEPSSLEDTLEINDIPLNNEKVDSYKEPRMEEPVIESVPVNPDLATNNIETVQTDAPVMETIEVSTSPAEGEIATEEHAAEPVDNVTPLESANEPVEVETFEMFEDLK